MADERTPQVTAKIPLRMAGAVNQPPEQEDTDDE